MEILRRLVIWGAVLVLTFVLFLRGHGSCKTDSVAFLRKCGRCITVRIAVDTPYGSIHTFPLNTDMLTAIKMTVQDTRVRATDLEPVNRVLKDGDIVQVTCQSHEVVDISIKKMQARERVVLGIALDPNTMSAEEWESLPGIGPALASRIVRDRQINGDFHSVSDLERVPGIGKKKIKQLSEYF